MYGNGSSGTASRRKALKGSQRRLDDNQTHFSIPLSSLSKSTVSTVPSSSLDSKRQRRTYGGRRHRRRKLQRSLRLFASALCLLTLTVLVLYRRANLPKGTVQEEDDDEQSPPYQPGQPLHRPELGGHLLQSRLHQRRHRAAGKIRGPWNNDLGQEVEHDAKNDSQGIRQHQQRRMQDLQHALDVMTDRIHHNLDQGIRWVHPGMVPPLSSDDRKPLLEITKHDVEPGSSYEKQFFSVSRPSVMAWQVEDQAKRKMERRPDYVDYTQHPYSYPDLVLKPPSHGEYPKLQPLQEIMQEWPQDELDRPPRMIHEVLMHFDYTNPVELQAARRFRDAQLPFKLVNVPEVIEAGKKWTDEYLATNFDGGYGTNGPPAKGTAQESVDNFFAFFIPPLWSILEMGLPPTLNNDWTFAKWSQHARYADHVGLGPNYPHFYWQAGVNREERHQSHNQWTFISRDLPSFSSPTETFFVFEPQHQKGIQCRFGERGVTAATHYDNGRNMIAMMTGAKRYILSPPRECSKLGVVNNNSDHAMFRHSMLNLGHLKDMDHPVMPPEERTWLERAATAESLSTVLKAGEVLYIPSFWFHYITSLQKSAQCNVRSGIDRESNAYFGGEDDVSHRCDAVEAKDE
jgi:Cupin-like domain